MSVLMFVLMSVLMSCFVSPLYLLCISFVSIGSEHSKLYVDWMGWDGSLNAPVIWAPYGANKGSTEARAEFLYQITSSNYWLAQKENVSSRSWSASLLWTWGTINININPKIVITFIIANRYKKDFIWTCPTPTAGWQSSALPAYSSSMPNRENTWLKLS